MSAILTSNGSSESDSHDAGQSSGSPQAGQLSGWVVTDHKGAHGANIT